MIDVVIPVCGRPQNAQKVYDSIKASTTVEHTVLFLAQFSDHDQYDACVATGALVDAVLWDCGQGDAAKKWNHGFATTSNPFVFLAADDLEFTPNWDVEVLRVAEQTGAGVVGTNDGMNPLVKRGKHSTHSLVRRTYIESVGGTLDEDPGVVYSESYDHQCVDNELVFLAKQRGEWAFAHRSVVIHHHPFFDKSVRRDSTYDKALRAGSQDIHLLRERMMAWSRKSRTR